MSAGPISRVHACASSWARSAEAGLSFRPMVEADMAFLRRVYGATRQPELDLVDWPQAQKDAFVAMQFDAQHAHYQLHHADMDWLIVGRCDERVGRLYLERGPSDHVIIDIAFLPAHRGQGLGTALLQDLLDEAASARRSMTIHVEKFNPALRLYRRLGFATIEDKGVYDLMRWTPQANTAS